MLAFWRTYFRKRFKRELDWAFKTWTLESESPRFLTQPLLSLPQFTQLHKSRRKYLKDGCKDWRHYTWICGTHCVLDYAVAILIIITVYNARRSSVHLSDTSAKKILAFSLKSPEKDFFNQNSQKNGYWLIDFLVSRQFTYNSCSFPCGKFFPDVQFHASICSYLVDIIYLSGGDCRLFRPR